MRYFILFLFLTSCNSAKQDDKLASQKSPDILTVPSKPIKTNVKFVSNRNYFDQRKIDTIIITNDGLPNENRLIEVSGALIHSIKGDSFTIRTSQYYPDLKEIKIKINQVSTSTNKNPVLFDTLTVTVK